ncbi:signal peptidase I [uncultured Thermanaerothrix sp.]|uniref:signal peptidase I n=1 Tax=uncultured Thermanaerothrix sp. TaxID=1195149 RepID=UPI00260AA1F9|nr:signal peptidase I [uncultured Thermanaerothrix sp.]
MVEKPSSETMTQPTLPRRDSVGWLQMFSEALQVIVLALLLYFVIDTFIARVRVENISMQPTLKPGEFVIVNKVAYRTGQVRRGDVIVFRYPMNPREDYIKRVIGLPGDHIEIKDGKVFVNGQALEEPYVAASPSYNGVWDVPPGQLFVLGDNRNQSSDSHSWGFVPIENVVGKALLVYWPPSEIKLLTPSSIVNAAR